LAFDAVSFVPALVALVVALLSVHVLTLRFGAPATEGRFTSIDGLRGYLAFAVFVHHACIWYFYLKTGRWEVPPSNLYTHFGQSAVALFFMITAFLFFNKLIDARLRGIDWLRLFASRLLRLTPLYLFAIALLFAIVAVLSKGQVNEPLPALAIKAARWAGFTVFGAPDLNGVEPTSLITAWVTWSLPYEWIFYFSLPLLALCVGIVPSWPMVALGVLAALAYHFCYLLPIHLLSFGGGMLAAVLVRNPSFRSLAGRRAMVLPMFAAIMALVYFHGSAHGLAPILLLTFVFAVIAGGNTLFGMLSWPASRVMGDMAYSLYILHGIVLFLTFKFVIGFDAASRFGPVTHWAVVIALTPLLMLSCFSSFRNIEQPFMRRTEAVVAYLRRLPGSGSFWISAPVVPRS
jgi:peptidoglycan/LPS O-acetylase OafA/YrhL